MDKTLKHYLFKLKWAVALAVFGVCIGFIGESSLVNRYEQWKEIARLQSEIEKLNSNFEADKAELERLKTDPDALQEVARERYLMKAEDEDIFVVEDEE